MKYIIFGIAGSSGLLGFYFLILTLVSGWDFAKIQFFQNWYWILGLSFGFGLQIGLFSRLRALRSKADGKVVAVSGSASGLSMIACCSHYLVNIIPIIGISGVASIVGRYQTEIFFVGLIFNLLGVGYMLNKTMELSKIKYVE